MFKLILIGLYITMQYVSLRSSQTLLCVCVCVCKSGEFLYALYKINNFRAKSTIISLIYAF